jgi:gluconate 2-dehydrogenase gamma chain
MTEIGRRTALRLIGAAPLALGFGVSAVEARMASSHSAQAVRAAAKGQVYKPKFFTAHEWETVRVLVDMIIPRDERSGSATDAGVPEFMDFLMMDPADSDRSREDRQTAMRGGLAWINSVCGRRFGRSFVECTEAERTALLDEIAYMKGDDEQEIDLAQPRDLRVRIEHGPAFFNSFRDLTASGFWTSKMGMDDLQYQGNTFVAEWKGPPREVLVRLGLAEE